ncbi:hypothetical protein SAMN04489867_0812 [Pedococcus dokdonensis]|uniref:Uncharacterized protein n=1 Tax=Pedococcus dokdonensis TaxID=443156 RepID=A0A1H0N412_9MICO|nr:hypothetical protein [Pedococcus dokdonensis]SDO87245.1 hypothetical protein SAMN04489867_0812 [Pedococcus dokdonensis]
MLDHDDHPDACRWAARWRAPVLALAATIPDDRPLGVVLLGPAHGLVRLSSHAQYRTAGPARSRAGRMPGDDSMSEAKARAAVVCRLGHIH